MKASFAYLRSTLYGVACALALAGPALAQDAAVELAAARQAVERAIAADADHYAGDRMAAAQQLLEQAQRAALDKRERKQAPALARRAEVDADLARVLSEEAVANALLQQRKAEVAELQAGLADGEVR